MAETENLPSAPSASSCLPAQPALRGANPQEILKRYLSDERTVDIAASYGVTRQALGQFLLKHAEEEWKEAQVARAIARKEKAEDDLESAADGLSLARARELLKSAQWDLERVCRRIYGEEKAQINVHGDGVKIELVSFAPQEKT